MPNQIVELQTDPMRRPALQHWILIALALTAPVHWAVADDATLGQRDQQRLSIFKLTLQGDIGGVDAATRSASAVELLGMQHPMADQVLADSMNSDRAEVLRAIFMALADDHDAHRVLVDVAFDRLPSVPADARESLAILLARAASTTPSIVDRLRTMADNADAVDAQRLAAIAVLGECRHTPVRAAAALMALLEQPLVQSQAVITGATDALARLTGLPPDDDVEIWVAWWSANRDRPAERWLADMVQALSRRVADLEHRQADAAQQQQVLAERMLTIHRNLWPLLSAEAQADKLPELLADDLSQLRRFGVTRAAVLLRDGNATDDTNTAVLARLDDPDASVRLAVAQLLPELPSANVPTQVNTRLSLERNRLVANALLQYCVDHPDATMDLEALSHHLSHASACTLAGEAMWVRLDEPIETDTSVLLAEAVAAAQLANPEKPLSHLAAMLGDDEALAAIMPLLNSEHPEDRTRTAEALRRRGDIDPVLARATDPAVFPVLVRSMQSGNGLRDFTAIASLTPVEPHMDLWQAALLNAAASTPLSNRVEVDLALEAIDGIEPQERIDLLIPTVAPEHSVDERLAAAQRLVPLLAATGEDRALIALVSALPKEHRPLSLDDAAFVAALRSRQFDSAATLRSDPRVWVTAFESLQLGRPELADMLRTEIVRRFHEDLPDTLRTRLGMASDPLMGDASDPPGA